MNPRTRYDKLKKLKTRAEAMLHDSVGKDKTRGRRELRVITEEIRLCKIEIIKQNEARHRDEDATNKSADAVLTVAEHAAAAMPIGNRLRFWRRILDAVSRKRLEAMNELDRHNLEISKRGNQTPVTK